MVTCKMHLSHDRSSSAHTARRVSSANKHHLRCPRDVGNVLPRARRTGVARHVARAVKRPARCCRDGAVRQAAALQPLYFVPALRVREGSGAGWVVTMGREGGV